MFHDVCGTLNGRMFKDGSMLYGCTCNLSIALDLVPLSFDESFRSASFEDVDFCVCARKRGIPVTYNKDAIVRHHYDAGIMGLFRHVSLASYKPPSNTNYGPFQACFASLQTLQASLIENKHFKPHQQQ